MPISTTDLVRADVHKTVEGDSETKTMTRDDFTAKGSPTYAPDQAPVPPTVPCLITDFFEYQVRVRPDAPAVQFESDAAVTYADLGWLSHRIAHVLSIPRKTIVPVCMDVSVDFIATILAILISGACYVILDPKGPTERNKRIVESCNAGTVVVDEAHASVHPHSVVLKTALSRMVRKSEKGQHSNAFHIADPAYLVYTSGKCPVSCYEEL